MPLFISRPRIQAVLKIAKKKYKPWLLFRTLRYFNYTYRSGKCCQKLHIFLYVEILCYINQSPSIFDHEPRSNCGLKNWSVFVVIVGGEESALLIWKVSNLLIMESAVILCLLKYNLYYLIGDAYAVEFSSLF